MDYKAKLQRMDEHLQKHPHDYQTVIARIKTVSDAIEHERHKKRVWRLKRLAEVRRQMREIENGRM